jgi:tetratricopeptide (TPR) repeat protein
VRQTLLLALAVAIASPTLAQAQTPSPDQVAQAKEHFAKGRKLYDAGDKPGAVEQFKQAYKLTRNPLLLYNVGFVYDELNDRALAVHYYEKFLADAPDDAKTKGNRTLATDRVTILKKEIADEEAAAAAAAAAAAKTEPAPAAEPAKRGVTEFTHVVLEAAPPKLPLDVTAKIPVDATWNLMLFYRPAGTDDFTAVKMQQRFGEMVGRIPAEATAGGNVQYYIEVKDQTGNIVSASGKARSPNIVYLEPGTKPHYYRDLSENGSGQMVGDDVESEEEAARARAAALAAIPSEPIRPITYAKWATTGGSVVLLGTAVALFLAAKNSSSTIESEATDSRSPPSGTCPGVTTGDPPCTQFSDYQKALQDTGERYELWTNITLVAGVAAAAAAGTLWYLDLRQSKATKHRSSAAAAPVLTSDFVGGAAVISF